MKTVDLHGVDLAERAEAEGSSSPIESEAWLGAGHDPSLRLSYDVRDRARMGRDFGGTVCGSPAVVAYPRTAAGVAQALKFAIRRGLTVTPRGVGSSCGGQ